MATVMLEGYGKPGQLTAEYRKCIERMFWNEFGELAKLTSLKVTDEDGNEVDITDSSGSETSP